MDRRRRVLLLIQMAMVAVLCSFSPSAQAQQARVDRLEVVESGFYTARRTGKTEAAPSTATGFTSTVTDVEFLKTAPAEPARIGTAFGVRFRSFGPRRDAKATLRTVWKIPAPGITNPKTGNTYRVDTANFTTTVGTRHVRGYRFSDSWEIVRGTWTLEIWQGDRKLLVQDFAVQ